jgi:hypothetical protein
MPPSPCRGIHGTVKVLHETVRGLHETVKRLRETVKSLHETAKRLLEAVKVLHETVKVFAPHPWRAHRLQGGAASRSGRWRMGEGHEE